MFEAQNKQINSDPYEDLHRVSTGNSQLSFDEFSYENTHTGLGFSTGFLDYKEENNLRLDGNDLQCLQISKEVNESDQQGLIDELNCELESMKDFNGLITPFERNPD